MEAIASDDKQCDPGKYQDPDEGYRISFVTNVTTRDPPPPQDEPNSLPAGLVALCYGLREIVFSAAVLPP